MRRKIEAAPSDSREAALSWLARREHSAAELHARLARRGASAAVIADTLSALQAAGLQSDARFAAEFVRARHQRGDGPVKIEAALRARGLDEHVIRPLLDDAGMDWDQAARRARRKRFGAGLPTDARSRARQLRFLQQRGFTAAQCRAALQAQEQTQA